MVAAGLAQQWLAWQTMVMGSGIFKIWGMLLVSTVLLTGVWMNTIRGSASPGSFPILFYQQIIGHLDGRACPSTPVCSSYARQSIGEYGFLIGSLLMIDRLIHEADDLHMGPWVVEDGYQRLYDPVSRNSVWVRK